MTMVRDIYEFSEALDDSFYDQKKILIEGDSWVSHPLVENIATQIEKFDTDRNLVLNIASPGDEAVEIFKPHGSQMKRLKKLLGAEDWGDTFDLIFLSAAGNDIVGPEIVAKGYVKNKRDFLNLYGRELITDNYYNAISEVVKGYRSFLKFRNNSGLNENTPVITHSYGYLTPREVGTHIGPLKFNKGWIKVHLKHQGIKDEDEQYEILIEMMDAFHKRMRKIEGEFERFLVVDTRTVLLKNGKPDMNLWYDEIHPNSRGFKKLTKYIKKVSVSAGLWNI